MSTITVLYIPADANAATEVRDVDLSVSANEMVGGWFEHVVLPGHLVMWCNEDGHALALPPNRRASQVATLAIRGNVFVTGPTIGGDSASLTERELEQLHRAAR